MKYVARFSTTAIALLFTTGSAAAPGLSFWKALDTPIANESVGGVASADLNGDEIPDLVVTTPDSGMVHVAAGLGDGGFDAPSSYAISTGPGHLALADLNNDARLDIVVAVQGTAALLGNGDGSFQPAVFSAGSGKDLVVADFDGDGRLDVASVGRNSTSVVPETVDIYQGAGDGTFGAPHTLLTTDRHPAALVAADFNGDGRPDLAFGERDIRQLRVMVNEGGFAFSTAGMTFIEVGPSRTAAADFDANGTADVVTANFAGTISVLFGNGDGTLQAAQTFDVAGKCGRRGCPSARSVSVADFDGDARPDIVTANDGAGSASILVNLGGGSFGGPIVLTAGSYTDAALGTDANRDGAADVLLVSSESAHVDPGVRAASTFLNRAGTKSRGQARVRD